MRRTCVILLGVMAVAVGCAPQVQRPATQDAEGQPKSGGVLKMRESVYFTNLDPTQGLRGEASFISNFVFDSLLGFKSDPTVKYDDVLLAPRLAERWEAAPGGKAYTFRLRKGVKFANLPPVNGRELTSADVKWSFEYIARTGPFKDVKFPKANQIAFKLQGLDRVETPDPYTAVVYFKNPYAPFLTYVATTHLGVMPHEVYDQDGHLNDRPIGSGPWQADLQRWQADSRMVFKKNPDYWDAGKPYLDEVQGLVITDDAAAVAAFQAKQIDVFRDIDSLEGVERMQAAVPGAGSVKYLGWNALRFYYNINVPPFTDVRFRRAMNLATDRDEFVRVSTKGQGAWAMNGAVPGVFTDAELRQLLPYKPEEAKRLLREAGYDPSTEIETLYTTGYGQQLLSDIQLLQAQLKKVGIQIKIVTLDRTDLSNRRRQGDYMMAPTGVGPALEPDPDVYFYSYFHPKSGTNYYKVDDPKLTQLAEEQRAEPDPIKRKEIWRQEARYINEMGYALWTHHAPGFDFWQAHVKGHHPNVATRGYPTRDVWLDR